MSASQKMYDARVSNAWRDPDEHEKRKRKGEIVPDGHAVEVPVMLSDGKPPAPPPKPELKFAHAANRPRFGQLSDAAQKARQQSYADRDQRTRDAWKGNDAEGDDNG